MLEQVPCAPRRVVGGEAEIPLTLVSEILPVERHGARSDRCPPSSRATSSSMPRSERGRRSGSRARTRRVRRGAAGGADVRRKRDRSDEAESAYTLAAAACFVLARTTHHSTAAVYNRDGALIEAEGVITNVAWVNPHVRFEMRGAGAGWRRARLWRHRIELREHHRAVSA